MLLANGITGRRDAGSDAPLDTLLLLDADPLADITNTTTLRTVVANGRYCDRAALERLPADTR